ncbi:MAG: hypothetical protein NTX25_13595 [Proteobacteria bacterium]|nr:hypothetical protein [Pseudomonadota bacterium]
MKKVRVPGKILLAGEYAVLEAHPALSLAIDRFLEVTLEKRSQDGWLIHSNLWQKSIELRQESAEQIAREPLLQVAAFAAQHYGLSNISCHVQSELDIRYGLGSSSAVRLAVLMAAHSLAKSASQWNEAQRIELARVSWQMQLEQQAFASGYDVLTQTLGGLLLWTPDYSYWPGTQLSRLPADKLSPWLSIMVGGKGAPTRTVGQSVRQALHEQNLESAFINASNHLVNAWIKLVTLGLEGLSPLIKAIAQHRQILAQTPYFPGDLFNKLATLPGFDKSWSLKTSGAGGEDALLLVGAAADREAARKFLAGEGWFELSCTWNAHGAELIEGT